MRTPKVIESPEVEPISIEDARAHLEAQPYGDSDLDPLDDAAIMRTLAAARRMCEGFLGLSLATQTLEIALDTFPAEEGIELPFGPVREIYSVSWGDDSDQEMAAADYRLDNYRKPNQLRRVSAWPTVASSPTAVKIRYLAGYGVDSEGGEALPEDMRHAILVELTNLRENRGDEMISSHARALLWPYQVRKGMA